MAGNPKLMKTNTSTNKGPLPRHPRSVFVALCCMAIGCGSFATAARAAVIHHTPNEAIVIDDNYQWSVTGSEHIDFQFQWATDELEAIYTEFPPSTNNWSIAAPSGDLVAPLTIGQIWGPDSRRANTGVIFFYSESQHLLEYGEESYVGFSFALDGNPDNVRYGWALVTLESTSVTLHQWAYENTGEAIVVGNPLNAAVPEPSSIVFLLGAGLFAGGAFLRRRAAGSDLFLA